mmetsp:Transcript_88337/g.245167  ORF Transcript_88337/g.245167 Transcript_88337/m.245167 type:complete len:279 (-) Transcript_88337:213-1049(-)
MMAARSDSLEASALQTSTPTPTCATPRGKKTPSMSETSFQLPPTASCSIVIVNLSLSSGLGSSCTTGARMSRKYRFLSVLSRSLPHRSFWVRCASKTHHVRRSGVTFGSHSRTVPMQPALSMARAKGDFSTSDSLNSLGAWWLFAKVSHQYVTADVPCKCRERACNCSIRTVKVKGVPHQWQTIHIGGCLPCATSSTKEQVLAFVRGRTKWSLTWYIVSSSQLTLIPRLPPSGPLKGSTMSYLRKVSWMKACSSRSCFKLTPRKAVSPIGVQTWWRFP